MNTQNISIKVDAESARAFADAPADERRRLQLLLALRLRELTTAPSRPLAQIMDEIGQQARANGLSPQVLESLLNAQ